MLKTLLKKQFLEIGTLYFRNRKTGKNRGTAGTVGFIILFAFLFISLGAAFFGVAMMMAETLLPSGLNWLYFAMMSLMAIAFGTFGSVFSTYSSVYNAKDNELLLSMPIPPSRILFVRIVGVYVMGLVYASLIFIPSLIAYWLNVQPTALMVVLQILLMFIVSIFILTLTLILGWIVALVASKIKNKSIITVFLSLAFMALYYILYSRINEFLQLLLLNSTQIGNTIKTVGYPIYELGLALTGDITATLIFTLIVAVLFAIVYFILSRTFIKIATTSGGSKKSKYKAQKAKKSSLKTALLKKEFRRFFASPTYMLNCALGTLFMPALAIFAVIKSDVISQFIFELTEAMPKIAQCVPLFAVAAVCMMSTLNDITAPSVSLEGKNLWIIRSLPVNTKDILDAKQMLHLLLTVPPAVISMVLLAIVTGSDIMTSVLMVLSVFSFVQLMSAIGLFLNLKKPNLDWTNETVPVKQSFSVVITLFGGWFIVIAFAALYLLLWKFIPPILYLVIVTAVFESGTILLNSWIRKHGTKIFEEL